MIKNFFLLQLFLFIGIYIYAQDNSLTYLMKNNPYNTFSNPAKPVLFDYYIGVPMLSCNSISFSNSFKYSEIIKKSTDSEGNSSLVITPRNLYDALDNSNSVFLGLNTELFGGGFRVKNTFIGLSLVERADVDVRYPKDLVGLFVNGNTYYVDKPLTINDVDVNAKAYIELSAIIQQQISDRLSVGIRPKLLFGQANLRTDHFHSTITTASNYDSININDDILLNTCCVYDVFGKSNKMTSLFSNPGFAIDLGASYKINDRFGIDLSVLDLGFIKWKAYNYDLQSIGDTTFSGLTIDDLSFDYDFSNFSDSLFNCFYFDTIPGNKYMTRTNTRILAEGYFDLNEHHRFTLATRFDILNGYNHSYISAGYTGNFFNWLEVVANTYYYRNSLKVGIGAGANIGKLFKIYFTTDDLCMFADYKDIRKANITVGMLFNVGRNDYERIRHGSLNN